MKIRVLCVLVISGLFIFQGPAPLCAPSERPPEKVASDGSEAAQTQKDTAQPAVPVGDAYKEATKSQAAPEGGALPTSKTSGAVPVGDAYKQATASWTVPEGGVLPTAIAQGAVPEGTALPTAKTSGTVPVGDAYKEATKSRAPPAEDKSLTREQTPEKKGPEKEAAAGKEKVIESLHERIRLLEGAENKDKTAIEQLRRADKKEVKKDLRAAPGASAETGKAKETPKVEGRGAVPAGDALPTSIAQGAVPAGDVLPTSKAQGTAPPAPKRTSTRTVPAGVAAPASKQGEKGLKKVEEGPKKAEEPKKAGPAGTALPTSIARGAVPARDVLPTAKTSGAAEGLKRTTDRRPQTKDQRLKTEEPKKAEEPKKTTDQRPETKDQKLKTEEMKKAKEPKKTTDQRPKTKDQKLKTEEAKKAEEPKKTQPAKPLETVVAVPAKVEEPKKETSPAIDTATRAREAFCRGITYSQQKEYSKAKGEFESALALNPDLLAARIELARSCEGLKEYDKALEHYAGITSRMPYATGVYLKMAEIYVQKKDVSHAVKVLREAVALNPAAGSLHERLGIIYYEAGEPERAKEEFLKELAVNNDAKGSIGYLDLMRKAAAGGGASKKASTGKAAAGGGAAEKAATRKAAAAEKSAARKTQRQETAKEKAGPAANFGTRSRTEKGVL